ncbi:alpha/beta hydrolase fold domain-containing protein [Nocardiopsis rhodophaea]|uniref:alpha/beta hydrolase fold domain-containing protein n=1 Tax=Nocardiopsis rhodophaea TaxID=280238 RepID=UPI0031D6E8DF
MPTTTRIDATADERAAVRELLSAWPLAVADMPADADTTDLLPYTGGVPGDWVDADRRGISAGVLMYVHGGGFRFTNPDAERVLTYRLSRATGRPGLRVDFRLVPDHPFPAAVEDVTAAYRSLLDQGVPASRIILAGESSGGTLLLSSLLVLKEEGTALPGGAVAVGPLTDLTFSSPSMTANEGKDIISGAGHDSVAEDYLNGAAPDEAPQSPLFGDLRGLPPVLLAAGGDELMLDDARRFADAATAAGVDTTLDIYEGMPHVFHAVTLNEAIPPTGTTFLSRLTTWVDHQDNA